MKMNELGWTNVNKWNEMKGILSLTRFLSQGEQGHVYPQENIHPLCLQWKRNTSICKFLPLFFIFKSISSSEFRKVFFNAKPSRHVRSQSDQAYSRGFSVTWDPRLDTCWIHCSKKKDRKKVRMDQKRTKRQNDLAPWQHSGDDISRVTSNVQFRGYTLPYTSRKFAKLRKFIPVQYG